MPQKLKSSHKHMIVLNVGASKNETKGSEELLTQEFVGYCSCKPSLIKDNVSFFKNLNKRKILFPTSFHL